MTNDQWKPNIGKWSMSREIEVPKQEFHVAISWEEWSKRTVTNDIQTRVSVTAFRMGSVLSLRWAVGLLSWVCYVPFLWPKLIPGSGERRPLQVEILVQSFPRLAVVDVYLSNTYVFANRTCINGLSWKRRAGGTSVGMNTTGVNITWVPENTKVLGRREASRVVCIACDYLVKLNMHSHVW